MVGLVTERRVPGPGELALLSWARLSRPIQCTRRQNRVPPPLILPRAAQVRGGRLGLLATPHLPRAVNGAADSL